MIFFRVLDLKEKSFLNVGLNVGTIFSFSDAPKFYTKCHNNIKFVAIFLHVLSKFYFVILYCYCQPYYHIFIVLDVKHLIFAASNF